MTLFINRVLRSISTFWDSLLESFLTTPGEIRITSEDVLKNCIKEGVKKGLFGAGDEEDGKLNCRYFEDTFDPELVEGEVLIKAELCKIEEFKKEIGVVSEKKTGDQYIPGEVKTGDQGEPPRTSPVESYHRIRLKLRVPSGKLSDIVRMVTYIKQKFDQVDVGVDISTQEGEITVPDYEDKIKEAIQQADVVIEKEEIE